MRVFVEVRSIREDHSCCDGGMLFRADFTMLLFPCLWDHARWCAIISKHRRHIVEFCALSLGPRYLDLCHTFLHDARAEEPTFGRESHAISTRTYVSPARAWILRLAHRAKTGDEITHLGSKAAMRWLVR